MQKSIIINLWYTEVANLTITEFREIVNNLAKPRTVSIEDDTSTH